MFYINDAIRSLDKISEGDISNSTKVDLLETIEVLQSLQPLHTKWREEVREDEYPYCFSAWLRNVPETLEEYYDYAFNTAT